MNRDQIQPLADRIEGAASLELELAVATLEGLRAALPQAGPDLRPGVVESTDAALHLVTRLVPDWSVALSGTAHEPDGRWKCTLRPSGARDDEEVIGIGRAPTPPLALIAALLRVTIARAKGYE
jgi:hypothetical protein